MEDKAPRKSLDERIDEHNKTRPVKTDEALSNHTSLTTEERLTETHNTISSPHGDSAAENKVATSLEN